MVNPERGEVALTVNGEARVMRLTLGALAALEARLEAQSLMALVEDLEGGTFSSRQLIGILWAGLNGGGTEMSFEDVGAARIAGGPVAAAQAAGALLRLTFVGDADGAA